MTGSNRKCLVLLAFQDVRLAFVVDSGSEQGVDLDDHSHFITIVVADHAQGETGF